MEYKFLVVERHEMTAGICRDVPVMPFHSMQKIDWSKRMNGIMGIIRAVAIPIWQGYNQK